MGQAYNGLWTPVGLTRTFCRSPVHCWTLCAWIAHSSSPGTVSAVAAEPVAGPLSTLSADEGAEARLRTRVAWHYFIEGLTQGEIARRLGLNRVRVNRILAACREDGTVQIRINSRFAPFVGLERRLEVVWGLDGAVVVPTPLESLQLPAVVGAAAGAWLSEHLAEARSVGIGWGRTLRCSLNAVRRRPLPGVSVVSLIGGLTRASAMNAYETAAHLADLINSECFYLAAPVYADSEATRDLLTAQGMLKDVFERGARVDLALVSVGDLGPEATMTRLGLLDADEVASLREAGAEGDILGHYINADGRVLDHSVNRRVLAMHPDALVDVPSVILASGGEAKIGAIGGALRAGYVNVLITDEATARTLLADRDEA